VVATVHSAEVPGGQFPERGWQAGRVTISERIGAARRERREQARLTY
jgi:hypothetical protein